MLWETSVWSARVTTKTRFPAVDGARWMDLTGLSNTATGITQAMATRPGASYTLAFQLGNIVNPGENLRDHQFRGSERVNGQVVRTVTKSSGAGQCRRSSNW